MNQTTKEKTINFLKELIKIPSTRGQEGDAARFAQEAFSAICDHASLVPIDDSIIGDPDYDFIIPGFSYKNTPQVEVIFEGDPAGKAIVFNTHLDVVPPSAGQIDPFQPREENGLIFGRGSVDAKGQVATLYALGLIIRENKVELPGKVIFHLVVEEENGGNGTLAMVRRGVDADAAVILEPSELNVIPAVRGAVWFQIKVYGKATHSGNTIGRVSAIDKAFDVIQVLRDYHDQLLESSRHLPLFDAYQDPMPLTIGQIESGTWPATVPSEATLKGLIGFLPNKNRHEIQYELEEAIKNSGDAWLKDNYEITFPMLRNDGNMLPVDHPLVTMLVDSLKSNGIDTKIDAMRAACDAWQYANTVGIPTVVFGPGSLNVAHSAEEHIPIEEIMIAAETLYDLILNYSSQVDK